MRKIITFAIENSGAEHTQTGRCPMSALGQKQTSASISNQCPLYPQKRTLLTVMGRPLFAKSGYQSFFRAPRHVWVKQEPRVPPAGPRGDAG